LDRGNIPNRKKGKQDEYDHRGKTVIPVRYHTRYNTGEIMASGNFSIENKGSNPCYDPCQ